MYNLYFFDLDNTLLYTKNKLEPRKEYVTGFYKDGYPFSFIEKSTLNFIEDIIENKNNLFIPVTARNKKSYSNTIFFQNNNIKYEILSHGAEVFHNGKEDKEWSEIIKNKYKRISNHYDQEKIIKFISNNCNFLKLVKTIDGFYIKILFEKIDNKKIQKEINKIKEKFIDIEEYCTIAIDGRTIFIKPTFLDKKYAVEYLSSKISHNLLIGSGDSESDLGFLSLMDFSIIPKNSQIKLKVEGK